MKKKIYNKKKFWSGIVFLVLAAISIPMTINKFNDYGTARLIKSILIDAFCILIGTTELYRSLSSKCTREDEQNDDEREKLVNLKSKSKAADIIFFICGAVTILSMIGFGITRNDAWGGILVYSGVLFTIMVIVETCTYFYYDKRN